VSASAGEAADDYITKPFNILEVKARIKARLRRNSKNDDSKGSIASMNNAIYLLSPTFLTRAEAQTAKFAITRLMPFRFLKSEMDKVKSYHILSGNLTRSDRYELYAPGSVFYFENNEQREAFAGLIESKKEFRQIGYNEYK